MKNPSLKNTGEVENRVLFNLLILIQIPHIELVYNIDAFQITEPFVDIEIGVRIRNSNPSVSLLKS